MPTVMVIGASRGIGLELVRQYAAADWRVHATTRTPLQPGALGASAGDVVLHALDVRDAQQIGALAQEVEPEGIDVLIHNAGVAGRRLQLLVSEQRLNHSNVRAALEQMGREAVA